MVFVLLGGKLCRIEDRGLCLLECLNGFLPAGEQDVGGGHEPGFDVLLIEAGGLAVDFVFDFLVALPDRPLVGIVGMPELGAVPAAAVPAFDLAGEAVERQALICKETKLPVP